MAPPPDDAGLAAAAAASPMPARSRIPALTGRRRITTLSPCTVGRVATRRSIACEPITCLMRPSCGSRRSAMFNRARILMRDTTAFASRTGGGGMSTKIPSMRSRTARRAG